MIFSLLISQSIRAVKERKRLEKKQQYLNSNNQTNTGKEKTNHI